MRAAALGRVRVIEFDNRIEKLIVESQGVVGMCGYNTFCELLSFDKRALMVPRVSPRKEQYVRAFRAAELGLIDMLHPDEADDPRVMVEALKRLPTRPRPSDVGCRAHDERTGRDRRPDLRPDLAPPPADAVGHRRRDVS
jgi:predicted glycosyltransferase